MRRSTRAQGGAEEHHSGDGGPDLRGPLLDARRLRRPPARARLLPLRCRSQPRRDRRHKAPAAGGRHRRRRRDGAAHSQCRRSRSRRGHSAGLRRSAPRPLPRAPALLALRARLASARRYNVIARAHDCSGATIRTSATCSALLATAERTICHDRHDHSDACAPIQVVGAVRDHLGRAHHRAVDRAAGARARARHRDHHRSRARARR